MTATQPAFQVPHNIELEQSVLGALLLDNRTRERVETLASSHFYDAVNGELFDLICSTIEAGRVASLITLKTAVTNWPPISNQLTVSQYMGRLAAHGASVFEVADYAKKIKELATRRAMIDIGYDLVSGASSEDESAALVLERAEVDLFALADKGRTSREVSIREAARTAINDANEARLRGGGLAGLSTGLADLDARLGGLVNSDLIVLAGRPSMGKTALATNIAYSVALDAKKNSQTQATVHIFSQEMSAVQLSLRLIGDHASVPSDRLRRGDFTDDELKRANTAAEHIGSLPIHIDETGGITLAQLVTKARRVKRQKGTVLLIIDYLQLMRPAGNRSGNETQHITEVTMGLKALSKELGIPILALSQLSRDVEKREDKRPQLSDLRSSGSIEQDADVVLFVYRDDYYLDRQEPPMDDPKYHEWQAKVSLAKGKAEVIVGKSRHTSIGIVTLAFDAERTRFDNLAKQEPSRYAY